MEPWCKDTQKCLRTTGTMVHTSSMNENLLPITIEMLKASELSMPAIAADTGLGVRWLHKLRAGGFQDPGVTKIIRLHGYLSKNWNKRP